MDNEFTTPHVHAVIVYNNQAVDVGEKLDRIASGISAVGYLLALVIVTLLAEVIHHW